MDFRSVLVTRSYEQVVQQIRGRIRSGMLVPGQRLPTERELADSFGVSRGVIREALKVLGSMGLVESRQGSGTYVCSNPVPSISRAMKAILAITSTTRCSRRTWCAIAAGRNSPSTRCSHRSR